jgi:predicted O-methyltransferase YrrM
VIATISQAELAYRWPINWLGLHRSYLNPGEMEIIAALLRDVEAKSMIEFGCRDGRTARVLLHNLTALHRYVGIDVTPDYTPVLAHQRSEMVEHPGWLALGDPRFDVIIRERGSLDLNSGDLEGWGAPFDAAFIDGDHSENVVLHDSRLARSIVRQDGVIVWHDYANVAVDVQRALDRLIDDGWPIKHVEGTWLAFMRT